MGRNFIDIYSEERAKRSADRHARAAAAVALNGGRSAPPAAASRPMGLTPEAKWRNRFPIEATAAPAATTETAGLVSAMAVPKTSSTPPSQTTPLPSITRSIAPTPARGGYEAPGQAGAAAIAQQYSTPSAPAQPKIFTPDSPERSSLFASHPAIFQAGTPENAAYVAFAKANGEDAAMANLNAILAPPAPQQKAPLISATAPTPAPQEEEE
jgi:hypothetical protein